MNACSVCGKSPAGDLWYHTRNHSKVVCSSCLSGLREDEFEGESFRLIAGGGGFGSLAKTSSEDADAVFRALDFAKTGRNEPCPCGSGKKYKRCCLARNGLV